MAVVQEHPFYFGSVFESQYKLKPADIPFKLLVPSLENMASVKLAIGLFIQKWTEKDSRPFYPSVVYRVRNEVLSDISVLKFPTSLKEKLSYDVVRVEKELENFIGFFRSPEDDDLVSRLDIKNIIWTSRGQIDYIDTAELIRNCEGIKQEVRDSDYYYQKYRLDPNFVYDTSRFSTSRITRTSKEEKAEIKSFFCSPRKKYGIWDQTFGKGIFLTKYKWFNPSHSMIQAYFICIRDQNRETFLQHWITYMHDTCFLLAKITGKMMKSVIHSLDYDLMDILLNRSLQEDYFFQMVTLIAAEMPRPHLSFIGIAITIVNRRTYLKDWPLACNHYTIFYDKFVEFLSQNVTDDQNMIAYCYLLLHRRSMDFAEIKSVLSRLNRIDRLQLLSLDNSSVCAFVLLENGLHILKRLVAHCYYKNKRNIETVMSDEGEYYVEKVKNNLAKRAEILFHYYDSNNFDGFRSFSNWICLRPPNYRYSIDDLFLTYLSLCIERDRDNFVASCQNGCYPVTDEEVYHTSSAVLNWICRYNQERVERIKLKCTTLLLMESCRFDEPGKFYKDFYDRMTTWLCGDDSE